VGIFIDTVLTLSNISDVESVALQLLKVYSLDLISLIEKD